MPVLPSAAPRRPLGGPWAAPRPSGKGGGLCSHMRGVPRGGASWKAEQGVPWQGPLQDAPCWRLVSREEPLPCPRPLTAGMLPPSQWPGLLSGDARRLAPQVARREGPLAGLGARRQLCGQVGRAG